MLHAKNAVGHPPPHLIPDTKINSKWNVNLKVKAKTNSSKKIEDQILMTLG